MPELPPLHGDFGGIFENKAVLVGAGVLVGVVGTVLARSKRRRRRR